jgi:hypothetical protein
VSSRPRTNTNVDGCSYLSSSRSRSDWSFFELKQIADENISVLVAGFHNVESPETEPIRVPVFNETVETVWAFLILLPFDNSTLHTYLLGVWRCLFTDAGRGG